MNASINPGTLPVGYCPDNYQDLLNVFSQNQSVTIPDALSSILWQSTAPSTAANTAWGKLDSLGRPVGVYWFAQGAWLRPHPATPGTTVWWFTALPDFTVYDGGDGNSISSISGPMWQQAQDVNGNTIAAAFPIVQGTLPSGTVLQLGVNGGEEFHTLVPGEDVPHQHFGFNSDTVQASVSATNNFAAFNNNANSSAGYNIAGDTTVPNLAPSNVVGGVTPPPQTNGATGGIIIPLGYTTQYQARGHQNMPPYVVGFLLQRTARLFYVG
jgi:hypothetical protein